MNNLTFRVELLVSPGRKYPWAESERSFRIKTNTAEYPIDLQDDVYYFEGRRLINIMSLHKSKKIAVPEMFTHPSEYDAVLETIYYNRPFVIFTEDGGHSIKMTFVNETVQDVMHISD